MCLQILCSKPERRVHQVHSDRSIGACKHGKEHHKNKCRQRNHAWALKMRTKINWVARIGLKTGRECLGMVRGKVQDNIFEENKSGSNRIQSRSSRRPVGTQSGTNFAFFGTCGRVGAAKIQVWFWMILAASRQAPRLAAKLYPTRCQKMQNWCRLAKSCTKTCKIGDMDRNRSRTTFPCPIFPCRAPI